MSALGQEKQTTKKQDTLQKVRTRKALNSVLTQILEHAGFDCEHCKDLLQKVTEHWCDRCGAETDRLKLNSRYGSDFQLCERCYKYD